MLAGKHPEDLGFATSMKEVMQHHMMKGNFNSVHPQLKNIGIVRVEVSNIGFKFVRKDEGLSNNRNQHFTNKYWNFSDSAQTKESNDKEEVSETEVDIIYHLGNDEQRDNLEEKEEEVVKLKGENLNLQEQLTKAHRIIKKMETEMKRLQSASME